MKSRYVYDNEEVRVQKDKHRFSRFVVRVLKFIVMSLSLTIIYYMVFALFISTDTERRLRQENRMFEKVYPDMLEKESLLADVVDGLKVKDDDIYEAVFSTSAPDMDFLTNTDILSSGDSIPDSDLVAYATRKLSGLEGSVANVEDNFMKILTFFDEGGVVMSPMKYPLDNFSFAQVGASVGEKINPFYKVKVAHSGLDLVSRAGEPVYATAPGVVLEAVRSRKGSGNYVVIEHEDGYVTKYAHLEDVAVPRGRRVRAGTVIGHVGVSGNSFAPHLHYEVLKDGKNMDPVHYFFGSLTPSEYANMVVMAASTRQSLD